MKRAGMTLIEILTAMAILVIVAAIGLISLNIPGQFARARNNQRANHLTAILAAVSQNIADNRTGIFTCASGDIPTSTKRMAVGAGNYDIAPCLVPIYLQNLPFDPSTTSARYNSVTDYDTGYYIVRATSTGEFTISAPAAELGKSIFIKR
jgi:prepilin-type N-terminal cleavage/methylation domain-containing protein